MDLTCSVLLRDILKKSRTSFLHEVSGLGRVFAWINGVGGALVEHEKLVQLWVWVTGNWLIRIPS